MRIPARSVVLALGAATCVLGACGSRDEEPPAPRGDAAPVAPSNRVQASASVRQNLGITFAKVERRAVANTLRVPGRFELLPDASREYRAMLSGQVEPVVRQFDEVGRGDVLFKLRSPRWREVQQQIADAEAGIRAARASAETIGPLRHAHHAHERALEESVSLWTERITQLQGIRDAGGGKADELAQARATLAAARADLAETLEKDAELEAKEREIASQLDASLTRRDLLLAAAATVTGATVGELVEAGGDGTPRWRAMDLVEVRAEAPGVVQSISLQTGAWAEESAMVLATVQPERLRFRAHGLQSDLHRLRAGLSASIAPPNGARLDEGVAMRGPLVLGLTANPDQRTLDLFLTPGALAPWARHGVSAFMEITLAGADQQLAIPLSAVARDGLAAVIFRRDPKDPDTVVRLDADLGLDDGRWVVVKSGVREGDEVVLDGVYQLMLATSGTAAKGGHFHSDGTFHEGED
jgi:hypothetical protein